MRFLFIEKKASARYDKCLTHGAEIPRHHDSRDDKEQVEDANEEMALLPKQQDEEFKIPESQNRVVRALPIQNCLSNPRTLVALFTVFIQAAVHSTFCATIPTFRVSLLDYSSSYCISAVLSSIQKQVGWSTNTARRSSPFAASPCWSLRSSSFDYQRIMW